MKNNDLQSVEEAMSSHWITKSVEDADSNGDDMKSTELDTVPLRPVPDKKKLGILFREWLIGQRDGNDLLLASYRREYEQKRESALSAWPPGVASRRLEILREFLVLCLSISKCEVFQRDNELLFRYIHLPFTVMSIDLSIYSNLELWEDFCESHYGRKIHLRRTRGKLII
jgi:hypothetical protein